MKVLTIAVVMLACVCSTAQNHAIPTDPPLTCTKLSLGNPIIAEGCVLAPGKTLNDVVVFLIEYQRVSLHLLEAQNTDEKKRFYARIAEIQAQLAEAERIAKGKK